jgi:hypothetical protein
MTNDKNPIQDAIDSANILTNPELQRVLSPILDASFELTKERLEKLGNAINELFGNKE